MDLLSHAPLGQSVCMYGRRGDLHLLLYCTCISPFLSPFLFNSWVRLFFLYSMAVYVFVVCVCMCLCGVVGLLSLSFSLDRRGDGGSMATQQRRRRGVSLARLQLRRC